VCSYLFCTSSFVHISMCEVAFHFPTAIRHLDIRRRQSYMILMPFFWLAIHDRFLPSSVLQIMNVRSPMIKPVVCCLLFSTGLDKCGLAVLKCLRCPINEQTARA
jgi:hypothetical protein